MIDTCKFSGKSDKNPPTIERNICLRVASEGLGRQITWKCLTNLPVILFLPPSGGVQAARRVTS